MSALGNDAFITIRIRVPRRPCQTTPKNSFLPLTHTTPQLMAEPAPSTEDRSRYETVKKELLSALPKKRAIDKQLVRKLTHDICVTLTYFQAQIEAQIHNLEATYLNETAQHSGGNIIHGFEGYLKNQTTGRRKYEISDQDRIFSNSSLTVAKVRFPFALLTCTQLTCISLWN